MQRNEDDRYLGDSPRLVGLLILIAIAAFVGILIVLGLIISRG